MIGLDRLLKWGNGLTEPSKATANLPTCPYAKRAFDDGRVSIIFKTAFRGADDINRIIHTWTDDFDVVLLVIERTAISAEDAHALAAVINEDTDATDLTVMVDHPDQPFVVGGYNNSQGDYLIFFVQRQSRLSAAASALKNTGYYMNWPHKV